MSLPNFFRRRSLLPGGGKSPPGGKVPTVSLGPGTDNAEVFTRPTVVPAGSPDEHAAAAMRSCVENEAANTAPAPRLEPPPSVSSLEPEPIEPAIAPLDLLRLGQSPPVEAAGSHAIPPPARTTSGALLNPESKSTGRTLSGMPLDVEGALGFVDAHPRSTHRPEARDSSASAEPEAMGALGEAPPVSISDLYAVGDFSGALAAAESVLERDANDPVARRYAEDCRRVLLKMCEARLGSFAQRPAATMGSDQLRWLALDHREGFLLSLVDGSSTLDDLLDICGMPRLDALRIFADLLDKGVIKLH